MGTIDYVRASSEAELRQVLEIQRQNRAENLGRDQREAEGFVTVRHHLELLEKMNEACAHILAKDGQRVAGYALCMHPKFKDEIPVIAAMFRRVERLIPGEPYMVMGQICIAWEYRRQGIFRKLYHCMLEAVKGEYGRIITEVDATNQRSLQAHYAVGFRDMEVYEADGRTWHLIELC